MVTTLHTAAHTPAGSFRSHLFDRFLGRSRRRGHAIPGDVVATAVTTTSPARGVLEIHLSNGNRRNVLGRTTIQQIEDLVSAPPAGTRVILLTADAPDFSAGYDLVEAYHHGAEQLIAHEENFRRLRESALPIVVALHGRVIGGGLELALAADVRLAAPDTRLAIPASALGLVYSMAGLRLFVDGLGESAVRAMVLAGRVMDAEDARSAGAVSEVVPAHELYDRALNVATTIAGWPQVATSNNRRMLDIATGRLDEDSEALRRASFEPRGALAARIEAFVAERHTSKDHRTLRLTKRGQFAAVSRRLIAPLRAKKRAAQPADMGFAMPAFPSAPSTYDDASAGVLESKVRA